MVVTIFAGLISIIPKLENVFVSLVNDMLILSYTAYYQGIYLLFSTSNPLKGVYPNNYSTILNNKPLTDLIIAGRRVENQKKKTSINISKGLPNCVR